VNRARSDHDNNTKASHQRGASLQGAPARHLPCASKRNHRSTRSHPRWPRPASRLPDGTAANQAACRPIAVPLTSASSDPSRHPHGSEDGQKPNQANETQEMPRKGRGAAVETWALGIRRRISLRGRPLIGASRSSSNGLHWSTGAMVL
jgi:hypothetical protein